MIDIQLIRQHLETTKDNLSFRGVKLDFNHLLELDEECKKSLIEKQSLEMERNQISKQIGVLKKDQQNVDSLMSQVDQINQTLKSTISKYNASKNALDQLLSSIPNLSHPSVPKGSDEQDNVVIQTVRENQCKQSKVDHIQIGQIFSGMDFDLASKLSQSRFVLLSGQIARLHRAIIQMMLDVHTRKNDYKEYYTPVLVNLNSMYHTGQLPKFSDDQFILEDDQLALIPTAEVPLTNLVANTIIDPKSLPLKYTAHTPCFRREAGSYGKDTRGMMRQHQFDKVELVWIIHPNEADAAFDQLVNDAVSILDLLELPYRKVMLCTGDLGFSACRTIDLEVWIPSQNTFREISSCSHCGDFQARRMKARFKEDGKSKLVHTLNGSGLAIGRTLIAIMENYFDGECIHIPKNLQPYLDNLDVLKPE